MQEMIRFPVLIKEKISHLTLKKGLSHSMLLVDTHIQWVTTVAL